VHDLRDDCYYCPELEISVYAVSILCVLFVDGILLLMQLSVNCYSCIIIVFIFNKNELLSLLVPTSNSWHTVCIIFSDRSRWIVKDEV